MLPQDCESELRYRLVKHFAFRSIGLITCNRCPKTFTTRGQLKFVSLRLSQCITLYHPTIRTVLCVLTLFLFALVAWSAHEIQSLQIASFRQETRPAV